MSKRFRFFYCITDRTIKPLLNCPAYREILVKSETPASYDVTQDVSSSDTGTTLTFSRESVPVSVDEIGNHVRIDVTAANEHGTKAYCSFQVTYIGEFTFLEQNKDGYVMVFD